MIRSTASAAAKWKPVPGGFRVDWGAVDLAAFRKKPRIIAHALATYNAIMFTASAARIAVSVLLWRMADSLRGSIRRGGNTLKAVSGVIRIGDRKRNWNVVVYITVNGNRPFEQSFESQSVAAT